MASSHFFFHNFLSFPKWFPKIALPFRHVSIETQSFDSDETKRTRRACHKTFHLRHGTRRPRPHLLRLLELGAEVGRRLRRFGVGRAHLHEKKRRNDFYFSFLFPISIFFSRWFVKKVKRNRPATKRHHQRALKRRRKLGRKKKLGNTEQKETLSSRRRVLIFNEKFQSSRRNSDLFLKIDRNRRRRERERERERERTLKNVQKIASSRPPKGCSRPPRRKGTLPFYFGKTPLGSTPQYPFVPETAAGVALQKNCDPDERSRTPQCAKTPSLFSQFYRHFHYTSRKRSRPSNTPFPPSFT